MTLAMRTRLMCSNFCPRSPYIHLVCNHSSITTLSCFADIRKAERLGMTLADVQLLIAHARNEADHPGFKASAAPKLNRNLLLNGPSGIFPLVSYLLPVLNKLSLCLTQIRMYRSEATPVMQYPQPKAQFAVNAMAFSLLMQSSAFLPATVVSK